MVCCKGRWRAARDLETLGVPVVLPEIGGQGGRRRAQLVNVTMPTEDFNALVSTTLAGFLYVSQLSVKQMLRQKSGSIVNVSTTLVDHPRAGVPVTVQVMAKGSLNAATRALAIEYAKDGIRVNAVVPGVIKTPMNPPETYESKKGSNPVGRLGEISEIVDAVLFLTDATFTTGEILHVDGGAHAGKW
jgi:NAD(P)-dependent dehydrogenase (short-subunit alcohol dehydrogenase family)